MVARSDTPITPSTGTVVVPQPAAAEDGEAPRPDEPPQRPGHAKLVCGEPQPEPEREASLGEAEEAQLIARMLGTTAVAHATTPHLLRLGIRTLAQDMLQDQHEAHRAWRAKYAHHPLWRRRIGLLDLSDECLHHVLVHCGPSWRTDAGTVVRAWDERATQHQHAETAPTFAPEVALWRRVWTYEAICTRTRAIGMAAEAVWHDLCERMWAEKAFVPAHARQLLSRRCGRDAFYFAMRDRTRTRIEPEELTAGLWRTRMKAAAGERLVSADPWHRGEPCLCILYNDDGTADVEAPVGPRPHALLPRRGIWRFAEHSHVEQSYVEYKGRRADGTSKPNFPPARVVRRHPRTWVCPVLI